MCALLIMITTLSYIAIFDWLNRLSNYVTLIMIGGDGACLLRSMRVPEVSVTWFDFLSNIAPPTFCQRCGEAWHLQMNKKVKLV